MVKQKKHSRAEIALKLARADNLAKQGKPQSKIAHTLGVSAMTLHRWRKALSTLHSTLVATNDPGHSDQDRGARGILDLQLENERLRRLVTDLLLQKMALEEARRENKSSPNRSSPKGASR